MTPYVRQGISLSRPSLPATHSGTISGMHDSTANWLNPMLREAVKRAWGPQEVLPLLLQTMFPAAEAANPAIDEISRMVDDDSGVRIAAQDWLGFGLLLRDKLGWDDTYPASPPDNDDDDGGEHIQLLNRLTVGAIYLPAHDLK